ncbi:MAG: NAD-dependent epimerase/dehydratase family protein [Candidatus Krumholzibacteriia bacterium]
MDLRAHYAGRTVLVTGAGGFIGRHLGAALDDLGARVRRLDRRAPAAGSAPAGAEILTRALGEGPPLDDVVDGCDWIFHLAGNASPALSTREPERDFSDNVVATQRLADAWRRRGGGGFVFASTALVYGEPQRPLLDETHPLRPGLPYAGGKLACEVLLESYARCWDLDLRRVRLFNTFGPGQRAYVLFDLLEKLRRDPRRLEILGTGAQRRAYNYVSDTVQALLCVGAHPAARGGVYNVGGDRPVTILELADLLIDAICLPRPEVTCTGQSWPGDVATLVGDTSRLRGLGYAPAVGFDEGLRRMVAWHREEFAPPW